MITGWNKWRHGGVAFAVSSPRLVSHTVMPTPVLLLVAWWLRSYVPLPAAGCSAEVWQYQWPNPSFLPSFQARIFPPLSVIAQFIHPYLTQAPCLPFSHLAICRSADWINPSYLWWPDPCIMQLSHDTVYHDKACACSPGWTDRLGLSDMTWKLSEQC